MVEQSQVSRHFCMTNRFAHEHQFPNLQFGNVIVWETIQQKKNNLLFS